MNKNIQANAEKLFKVQHQAKADVQTLQTSINGLLNWEEEMKRKEAELMDYEKVLPPVRSKKEKLIKVQRPKPEPRIGASDYSAWEKFDADKACEQIDMAEVGPPSLDSEESLNDIIAKELEEAANEKERGNNYVRQSKWEEAIGCYTRAVHLDPENAVFYANRALCYLKQNNFEMTLQDCTRAICLDTTYVKALLRRATAFEHLGGLLEARSDLARVLHFEPNNSVARKQLHSVTFKMERRSLVPPKVKTPLEKWKDGSAEGIVVTTPVQKPPHLRSKKALKPITIKEIPLGKTSPVKRIQIIETDDLSHGDGKKPSAGSPLDVISKKPGDKGDMPPSNGVEMKEKVKIASNSKIVEIEVIDEDVSEKEKLLEDNNKESKKRETEQININNDDKKETQNGNDKKIENDKGKENGNDKRLLNLVAPTNSVQFILEWRSLEDVKGGRSQYLSLIDPANIPKIFENALESDTLSSVLNTLAEAPAATREHSTASYLRGLAGTKRFSTLAMFLSTKDKHLVNNLLVQCKLKEGCPDELINDLKNKYEI